jgi:FKBP-type peptidyl-prolyl cis-trans isomerase SlyD
MSDETEALTVTRDRVVSFHYEIKDADGRVAESSRGDGPALALIGHGNLMLGLEEAMLNRHPGESFQTTLAPQQAYGDRREDWIQRISKKHFAKGARFHPGAQLSLRTDDGVRTVTILKNGNKFVDVDLNHPLAGQSIQIDVDLIEVREATREEMAHRHAHGAGGHHHH